jgi:endogenous inhibitor of DNA gyrase (YacG/DUF329 family)
MSKCKWCGKEFEASSASNGNTYCSKKCTTDAKEAKEKSISNTQQANRGDGINVIEGTAKIAKGSFWLLRKLKWILVGAGVVLIIAIVGMRIKNRGKNAELMKQNQAMYDSLMKTTH